MKHCILLLITMDLVWNNCSLAFSSISVVTFGNPKSTSWPSNMGLNDLNDDIQRAGRHKAKGGVGETAAGAVLGGLLLGPFGALFGAQIGAKIGAVNAVDRAKKDEMARLGVSEEMLTMAEEIGTALERSIEGLKASQDSFETQQSLARRLDSNAEDLYERAKVAMTSRHEEVAKKLLMDRQTVQDKLKKALVACAEEKMRLTKMRSNVDALEQRAMELDALLKRTVGANALQDSSTKFALSQGDPLLQKFRDMEID
jgi:hypothetical protein